MFTMIILDRQATGNGSNNGPTNNNTRRITTQDTTSENWKNINKINDTMTTLAIKPHMNTLKSILYIHRAHGIIVTLSLE